MPACWTLLFIILCTAAHSAEFTATVDSVHDGDTLTLSYAGEHHKARLLNIDAPELKQAYGVQAKAVLAQLVANQIVTVETDKRDKYGRLLATIYLPNHLNVNRTMVQAGYAWAYRAYLTDYSMFYFELLARVSDRGLWASPDPLEPWRWRHR